MATAPPPAAPEAPVAVTPVDPLPNKAVVAAIGTIVTVGLRWLISEDFGLGDEGVVALAGALTTVLVYLVSNYRRLIGKKP